MPLLIGYFETGFGLGEHVRGLAAALDAVGTPFAVYPYNAFTSRPRDEAPWAPRYDVTNAHGINILCMAPDQIANARRIVGDRFFTNSYNILIPPWNCRMHPRPGAATSISLMSFGRKAVSLPMHFGLFFPNQ